MPPDFDFDSEQEYFQSVPELAAAFAVPVEPAAPGSLAKSAFSGIKEGHLKNPKQMAVWHRRALGCRSPVVGATEAHVLLSMAAGLHAWSVPAAEIRKTRVAYFSNLVRRRLWRRVSRHLSKAVEALDDLKAEHGGVP